MRARLLVTLFFAPPTLHAQTDLPPAVRIGLDTLRAGNCEVALALWTQSWPGPQKASMAPTCPGLEQYGGELGGYDVLRVVDVSPHLKRIYVLLRYHTQPFYMMIVAYRPGEREWRVISLNWHSDPDQVMPPQLLPPQRPKP